MAPTIRTVRSKRHIVFSAVVMIAMMFGMGVLSLPRSDQRGPLVGSLTRSAYAAPGDEIPCALPPGMSGVCTGFNGFAAGTRFNSVPELVNTWDVRLGQVDYQTPGQPVAMDMCGNKPIVIALVPDPDDQVTLCNNHLMDNMFDTGNLGAITYRARDLVDVDDGYVTFTVDLNTTGRQTIAATVGTDVVRYPYVPSFAGAEDNHDPAGEGFTVFFSRDSVDVIEQRPGVNDVTTRIGWGNVACMGPDDRRCKVELRFSRTSLDVTVAGQALQRVTFARALTFSRGNLALVRQQYNPTKDCEGGITGGTDCPGFYDWTTDPAARDGVRGSALYPLNPNPRFPNPNSLYPGTPYMGYDTTHWDNFGFKAASVPARSVVGTDQKTIYRATSAERFAQTNPGQTYAPTRVSLTVPSGGAGRLVFSANGWAEGFSEVRLNGGPWRTLPTTGNGWRTKVLDGQTFVAGQNVVEFRSTRTTGVCCPPDGGYGFTVHRIDIEVDGVAPPPTPTPSGSPVGSPTPRPSTTPRPSGSATPTPSGTATPRPSGSATPTPRPSVTPTPTPRPTSTPVPPQAALNPMRISGRALLNGWPAPAGTVIQAMVGSTECGSATSTGMAFINYMLRVDSATQQSGCASQGANVTFTINGSTAVQSVRFVSDGSVVMTLSASGASSTPHPSSTPGPTSTPRPTTTPTPTPVPGAEPMEVSGWATLYGRPAPFGTQIRAYVGTTLCGSATSTGTFFFRITVASDAQTPDCGTEGDPVTFKIGTATAAQSIDFESGGTGFVMLSAP